jgi:hypothetical protein
MAHSSPIDVPKWALSALNHLYEIERKLTLHGDTAYISRNVERLKETFSGEGIFYENPLGQAFSETRADLDASISGEGTENLVVTEVIKPIIRYGTTEFSRVVQKGIVVVKSKEEGAQL